MLWREIPSFPDYEVSEHGDVRRAVPARGSVVGKVLVPWVRDDGYCMFILRRDGRSYHRKAHQLVIEAFVGPAPFPRAEVRHKDGTRSNNHYTNLEWGTTQDNRDDQRRHGTLCQGERHYAAKLTEAQVAEIRASTDLQRVLAARYGVQQSAISRIRSGARWAR